jgi:uncharacterized cupredoxin-like copper-binding protein
VATTDGPADRLERYWDAAVRGAPAPPDGLDPALIETIRRVRTVDDTPPPDPAFLARLEEELMHHPAAIPARRLGIPGDRAPSSLNGQGKELVAPNDRHGTTPRLRSPWSWLATAALVLLTLASGLAAFQLAPPSGRDDPPTLPAAQGPADEASPGAGDGAGRCRVAPSSLDRVSLGGTPSTSSALPLAAGPYEGQPVGTDRPVPLDGRPADPDTVAGVTEVVRELVACLNADDTARLVALFTDDYWRRLNAVEFGLGAEPNLDRAGSLVPLAGQEGIPSVEDVRVLADGRVAAVLRPRLEENEQFFNYYVFQRAADRWLIDEAVGVVDFVDIEIVVRDDGFEPTQPRVAADKDVKFVVRNEGTAPHSFVLPKFGIRLDVDPGQTEEEEFSPLGDGAWSFFSDIPGDREAGLVGTLIAGGGAAPPLGPASPVAEAEPAYAVPLASSTIEAHPPGSFEPKTLAILADRDVVVTLRNTEPAPAAANFTIDSLGIDVDLAPGETEEITINAPAGAYAFYSTLPGHTQAGMYGTLFVVEESPPTP